MKEYTTLPPASLAPVHSAVKEYTLTPASTAPVHSTVKEYTLPPASTAPVHSAVKEYTLLPASTAPVYSAVNAYALWPPLSQFIVLCKCPSRQNAATWMAQYITHKNVVKWLRVETSNPHWRTNVHTHSHTHKLLAHSFFSLLNGPAVKLVFLSVCASHVYCWILNKTKKGQSWWKKRLPHLCLIQ